MVNYFVGPLSYCQHSTCMEVLFSVLVIFGILVDSHVLCNNSVVHTGLLCG